ncbi:MAG: hypothetical protein JO024_06500 [Candidatus Eremiobacteraeota bacterium]|nr:hypothetical protein [Candidatus Eremiobacteraeota bacterium]
MRRNYIWLVAAVFGIGTAACSSSTTGGTPTPSSSCLAEVGASSALVFPANSAVGVPDNVGQVIIGTTTTLPAGWQIVLTGGGFLITSAGSLTPAPNPLPTPNTIPPFPNPIYQSGAFSTLPAATTFQVSVNNTGSTCIPTVVGVFTTQ